MTPGTVLHDPSFVFHDGEPGNKLFVALTDGGDGSVFALVTTSKEKHKGRNPGCQSADRRPNYFFPTTSSNFRADTWVLIDAPYEFDLAELQRKITLGEIRTLFQLGKPELSDLLLCAMESPDISLRDLDRLVETNDSLR